MFSIKNKFDPDLKLALDKGYYRNYRVIIQCSSLVERVLKKLKSYSSNTNKNISLINCVCTEVNSRVLERISELPEVKYITWDICANLCAKNIVSANKVYSYEECSLTGKNICIGLVDSGTYPHPDLTSGKNKITRFIDLVNSLDYPYDDNGHGTFMSGIIASNGSNSKIACRGIATESKIYSIKAFNSLGYGYASDILYAIEKLIQESKDLNLKIICLPFEFTSRNNFILSLFQRLFDIAVEKGMAVVLPSGNRGNYKYSICGIATLNNCIVVGGIDTSSPNIKPYEYSSCGPFCKSQKPNLVAACVDICSTNSNTRYISQRNGKKLYPTSIENSYTCYTGTSCAAAYISGICALLYEKKPDLGFNDLISLLKISCKLLSFPKWYQGSGMIDFNKLLAIK